MPLAPLDPRTVGMQLPRALSDRTALKGSTAGFLLFLLQSFSPNDQQPTAAYSRIKLCSAHHVVDAGHAPHHAHIAVGVAPVLREQAFRRLANCGWSAWCSPSL